MNTFLSICATLGFIIVSCNNPQARSTVINLDKKEMRVSDTTDSWGGDVTLSIVKIEKQDASKKILTVVSSYKGKDVGFELVLSSKDGKNGFHKTGLTIKSLGDVSNNFINSLAHIYNIKTDSTLTFIDTFTTTYVDLDEIAGNENKDKGIMTKLFLGNPDVQNDYGEVYLDIYEKAGKIELDEKDIEYRLAVIKAFCQNCQKQKQRKASGD